MGESFSKINEELIESNIERSISDSIVNYLENIEGLQFLYELSTDFGNGILNIKIENHISKVYLNGILENTYSSLKEDKRVLCELPKKLVEIYANDIKEVRITVYEKQSVDVFKYTITEVFDREENKLIG